MPTPEYFMARAIQLAERGLYTTDPNPRVGCVLVKDGQIIAEGYHMRAGEGHAEVNALHEASSRAAGADCYVTLEPCSHFGRTPPCVDALIRANVKRVFVAMTDPNPVVSGTGIQRLKNAGIEVHTGILASQSEKLNPGFCQRMRKSRPFVRSKLAMSMDGRTAMASGESKWITGPQARADVQKLRARSSAIMTGIGTVLADDPLLNVRPEQGEQAWYPPGQKVRQPLRIVVDGQLRMPGTARILGQENILLATAVDKPAPDNAETVLLPADGDVIDLSALMSVLARREINELMVEAGSVLNGALLQARLIDELVIYMAPKIMGDMARGGFHLPGMETMAQSISLHVTDMRAVGQDWRITATPEYNEEF
jgi:diaminohydroxyphosphoribosylaminopyrimidine deaminase / 5-amino-6-(5-phosphoribosylamino)uracil reductase